MTLQSLLTDYTARGGTLSGDQLGRAADEIWALMLRESRGRIAEAADSSAEETLISQCFSRLVDDAQEGETLSGETLGDWSRSYRDSGKSRERRLVSVLREYLGETGLLYRGWPA